MRLWTHSLGWHSSAGASVSTDAFHPMSIKTSSSLHAQMDLTALYRKRMEILLVSWLAIHLIKLDHSLIIWGTMMCAKFAAKFHYKTQSHCTLQWHLRSTLRYPADMRGVLSNARNIIVSCEGSRWTNSNNLEKPSLRMFLNVSLQCPELWHTISARPKRSIFWDEPSLKLHLRHWHCYNLSVSD